MRIWTSNFFVVFLFIFHFAGFCVEKERDYSKRIPLQAFFEKHKEFKFNPLDPDAKNYYRDLFESFRCEAESNQGVELKPFIAFDWYVKRSSTPTSAAMLVRFVLEEYRQPVNMLPNRVRYSGWSEYFNEELNERKKNNVLTDEGFLELEKYALAFDMRYIFPLCRLLSENLEVDPLNYSGGPSLIRDRLEYLLKLSRRHGDFYDGNKPIEEECLVYASWTLGGAAQLVLEDAISRRKIDSAIGNSSNGSDGDKDEIRRIQELIDFNLLLKKEGLVSALCKHRLADHNIGFVTNAIAMKMLFSEFTLKPDLAKKLALAVVGMLAIKYRDAIPNSDQQKPIREHAVEIVVGYKSCGDVTTDIIKESTGVSFDEDWYPGKARQ